MIDSFTAHDLPALDALQPEGWTSLLPAFELYLARGFAFPVKYLRDGEVVGVSNSSRFGPAAWLSHVIVHADHRGQGIAARLLDHLLERLDSQGVATVSLIATEAGRPLYLKKGFTDELEYVFLECGNAVAGGQTTDGPAHPRLRAARASDAPTLLHLDRQACGEDRRELLAPHLAEATVWEADGVCRGFWLPGLGEGLVVAEEASAGCELLAARLTKQSKVALPAANQTALCFLADRGWREVRRAWRMRRGPALDWRPRMIWSRIGGNFG